MRSSATLLVLDADAEPHVGQGKGETEEVPAPHHLAHPFWALGEDLEGVLRCPPRDVEHVADELLGDVLVEEVAHAVDEDAPRPPPVEGLLEAVRMHANVGEDAGPPHRVAGRLDVAVLGGPEALGDGLGVAVLAAG